jgi:muramoyltetrapeptide carboxypeptidase
MRLKNIGIPGVSSRWNQEDLTKAISVLQKEFSLNTTIAKAVLERMDPEAKAQEFMSMAFDQNIDFLLFARGGEGCADLMPYLEIFKPQFKTAQHKKMVLGMSDNTPLLLFLAECGWPVFYGHVAAYFSRELSFETRESFEALLNGKSMSPLDLFPLNQQAKALSCLEAEVTGGNFTLLNLSLKESFEFNASNKILVIEDWQEEGYQIDRLLKHFERIGKFSGVKAVIFGNFVGEIGETSKMTPEQVQSIQAALERFSARATFPVFSTKNLGHVKALKPIKFGMGRIQGSQLLG